MTTTFKAMRPSNRELAELIRAKVRVLPKSTPASIYQPLLDVADHLYPVMIRKGFPHGVREPRPITAEPYEVINKRDRTSHGTFATLEEAEGCVSVDKLTAYEIWECSEQVVAEEDGPATVEG